VLILKTGCGLDATAATALGPFPGQNKRIDLGAMSDRVCHQIARGGLHAAPDDRVAMNYAWITHPRQHRRCRGRLPTQVRSRHQVKGWFSSGVEFTKGQERPGQVEGVSALLQDVDNVHACRRGF
jgi:hypothetical protein